MSGARLPSSFDGDTEFYEENRWQKFSRRLREEPLVPLGCGLTVWALYNASKSMRKGAHNDVNKYFRARIYAQAFTLICVVAGGIYYRDERRLRRVFEDEQAMKKAREKNEAWIRELEARDQEDRELIERRQRMRAREAERAAAAVSGVSPEGQELLATARERDTEGGRATDGVVKSVLENSERKRRGLGILEALEDVRWR